jgi:hypothetical protein
MKNLTATKLYTLAFGLFLGLCIWKFGNPVILDHKIITPATPAEFFNEPWPLRWANWIFLPLAVLGALLICKNRHVRHSDKLEIGNRKSEMKWLWLLPLIWLGWQFISATQTVDEDLTRTTLWQFSGCVACYFLGGLIFARNHLWRWLLPGLLTAFTFCLVRGIDQHIFEFPQNHQMLVEGERNGWTNFPAAIIAEMKSDSMIITTNGIDVANPVILEKFKKGRVAGTLVYPNALAGIVLLLWPLSLALAFGVTQKLKPPIRLAVIGLTIFLGSTALFWSGSKLGWLIAIAIAGFYLLRLDWPKKIKLAAVTFVLLAGLGIFTIRFHNYLAAGATSVGARFDYWRAALQTTAAHPIFGTGPGTFQRSYAQIKSPEAEMARLAHNDYLEQFSDSGLLGGFTYVSWIVLALVVGGNFFWRNADAISFAMFAGLIAWFVQGFGEFSLFIPALSWTAFTLLGCLIGWKIIKIDK